MSVAAARRLWLIAGLVVAVLALNLVAVTQSWGAVIDIPVVVFLDWDGGEDGIRPLQAALYGSGLVPVGVALVGLLGAAHARNPELSPRDHWAERMPLRVEGVVPRGRAGSIMAGAVLILFVLAPWYATIHFARVVALRGSVCFAPTDEMGVGFWTLEWRGACPFDHQFRLAPSNATSCEGDTFQPFLEPLAWVVFLAAAMAATLSFLWSVARQSPQDDPAGH